MNMYEVVYRSEWGGAYSSIVSAHSDSHARNIVNKWRNVKEIITIKQISK